MKLISGGINITMSDNIVHWAIFPQLYSLPRQRKFGKSHPASGINLGERSGSVTLKAICLAAMILGLQAYVLDYFAAQRAATYLQHIDLALLRG